MKNKLITLPKVIAYHAITFGKVFCISKKATN